MYVFFFGAGAAAAVAAGVGASWAGAFAWTGIEFGLKSDCLVASLSFFLAVFSEVLRCRFWNSERRVSLMFWIKASIV